MNTTNVTISSNNVTTKNTSVNYEQKIKSIVEINEKNPAYISAEEFLNMVLHSYQKVFGSAKDRYHPEDLYNNIISVIEPVYATLDKVYDVYWSKNGR